MCDPASIAIAVGSAAVSAYGAKQQSDAQQAAANAIGAQNVAGQEAQVAGTQQRATAATAQTVAQKQAMQDTLSNQTAIANAMRGGQQAAIGQQQAVLGAENQQEAGLQATGNAAAQDLLGQTSADQLSGAQSNWQTTAANLLNTTGGIPSAPSGTTGDPVLDAALARRTAEAATNIRQYGADVAKAGSYNAPLNLVQNAITNNQTGIMTAQQAETLLKSGSDVRLAPASLAYGNATQYGNAAAQAAQQSGANALQLAGLQFQNTTDIANLQQANATTTAANVEAQAQADAAYKAQMGGVISGIGNLGLQGVGYYGSTPSFLKPGGLSKIFA